MIEPDIDRGATDEEVVAAYRGMGFSAEDAAAMMAAFRGRAPEGAYID